MVISNDDIEDFSSYTGCEGLWRRMWQLHKTENYKRLQKDPATANNELLHSIIKRFENEKLIHKSMAKSLYLSIPNSEGIKAVKTSLDNFLMKTIATKVITAFLSLILILNNFVFNCKNYIQIKDCSMGTICAPRLTPIYLRIILIENIRVVTRNFINLFKIHRWYIL